MRRDAFLKSLAGLAALSLLPLSARAAANLKMMIPANPGGGWDTTGRAIGKALQEAGAASSVTYDNKGGAAGAIGLAQFVSGNKGDPNALMTMGAVMLAASSPANRRCRFRRPRRSRASPANTTSSCCRRTRRSRA